MEEKLQQEIQDPAPQAVAPSQSEVVQPKEPDLITRVSQVKTEVKLNRSWTKSSILTSWILRLRNFQTRS